MERLTRLLAAPALLCLLTALGGPAACAHTPGASATTSEAPVLPLAKVRLYESGVGYFERAGELRGSGAALPVPSAHLDDAIKSLVVLSKDGSVEDISFDSRLSPAVARARAGLPPDTDEDLAYSTLLETLKGASVDIRASGQRIRGRLVEVASVSPGEVGYRAPAPAPKRRARGKQDDGEDSSGESAQVPPSPQLYVTVYTEDGEFKRVDALTIDSLRPVDPAQRRRFAAALEAQETSGYQMSTTLTLDASTRGPVRLGYLAEAPIWRTTFRLVVDEGGAATLQGWALVHNDTDEDWRGVSLELVNGRPDSFLYPVAAPRYDRRELETPPKELSSIPQLLVTTPDAQWGDFADTWAGLSGGTGSGYGRGSGAGFGSRGKRVPKARMAKAKVDTRADSSYLLTLGDLAVVAGAEGKEAETVFVYSARRPLNLAAHRSAMVPFLHESIDATPLVRFASFRHEARHAIRLVNNTSKTLPPGPVAIFGDGGFMGEATLARLKPGERQFAEIGDDPDTELELLSSEMTQFDTKRVVFTNDRLENHYLETNEYELRFVNRSGREREVHVTLDIGRNAKVEGADGIDYDSAEHHPLAIFKVPKGRGETRKLVVTEALMRKTELASVDEELLATLAKAIGETSEAGVILTASSTLSRAVATAKAAATEVEGEIETVEQDMERYREHLKALGDGDAKAKDPLVKRLLGAEDKLQQLREKQRAAALTLERERERLKTELDKL